MLDFTVEIADVGQLNRVLKAIERVDGVITARRVRAWQDRS
jgi:GTP pyrophosphokinase